MPAAVASTIVYSAVKKVMAGAGVSTFLDRYRSSLHYTNEARFFYPKMTQKVFEKIIAEFEPSEGNISGYPYPHPTLSLP